MVRQRLLCGRKNLNISPAFFKAEKTIHNKSEYDIVYPGFIQTKSNSRYYIGLGVFLGQLARSNYGARPMRAQNYYDSTAKTEEEEKANFIFPRRLNFSRTNTQTAKMLHVLHYRAGLTDSS